MAAKTKGTFNLQTGSSKEIANGQYTFTLFSMVDKMANICSDPNITDSSISRRLEISIKVMINSIPNKNTRKELKETRLERVNEAKKMFKEKKLSSDEYNDMLIDINTDTLGEVMGVLDNLLGIVETQYVMPMLNPEIQRQLEERFYGKKSGDYDDESE